MSAVDSRIMPPPPPGQRRLCLKCTGLNGAHYLTCPTLQLEYEGEDDSDV